MLDQSGLDTELARLLHRTERVDLATLRGSLEEVRRSRPEDGPTLARILAGRGVLGEAELADLLGQLGPTSSRLTTSFEASAYGAPRPERTQLPGARPSGRFGSIPLPGASDLARPQPGPVDGTERAMFPRALASASGERVAPAAGGRPSASWDVRPVSDSGERVDGWRLGGRIGDYVLESQAGAGAMGVVFIGRHVTTGARSAIKTVRSTADEEMLERFRREGEAQAKVDGHPNVARVHSMGEAYGRMFLVMELVEGGNLEQRVKLGLPSFAEAARMVAGIAHGLAHMHARDVLHRDLKPANVLFDLEGAPKLVDFGLARLAGASRLTVTGEVIGTPAFMAPEQTSGLHDQIGPWTDIWALGGVLFFVLTGRTPFDGRTALEVMTRVAVEEAPSPRATRAEVPQELDALCRRLMCRDGARRPSAADAAQALEAYAARQAVAPVAERPRSNKAVLALGGIAALSLVAGGLALALAPRPADDAASIAPIATTASRSVATTGIPARRLLVPPPSPVTEAPEPAAPAAQTPPWVVGQDRRCVVTVRIEGELQMPMQQIDLAMTQRLDMTWRVKAVEAGRVVIDATIDQFAITTVARPPEGAAGGFSWDVSYDSQRESDATTSPFRQVVGSSLKLIVDAATGQVLEQQGAEAVQRLVVERATADAGDGGGERMRAFMLHQIPLLADGVALQETLNGGLHAFPAGGRPRGGRWLLRREPDVTGRSVWPGGCWADVELTMDDDGVVTWSGRREATFTPQSRWAPPGAQGRLERVIKGTATIAPDAGRVASAAYQESWKTAIVGQTAGGSSAVYDITIELTNAP